MIPAAARRVLLANRAGGWTVPARGLCPHQWNWDSAFISMGYATFDQERAQRELLSLFRGQWMNGMLPHIVFNPEAAGYFPGPEFWRSSSIPRAPQDVETSEVSKRTVSTGTRTSSAPRWFAWCSGRGSGSITSPRPAEGSALRTSPGQRLFFSTSSPIPRHRSSLCAEAAHRPPGEGLSSSPASGAPTTAAS